MSSFLQKLKGKGVVDSGQDGQDQEHLDAEPAPVHSDTPAGVTQLPVDVYQSDTEIVIYAQIPGASVSELDVSIEGDSDVITIQGVQHRPEELASKGSVEEPNKGEDEGENVHINVGAHTEVHEENGEFSFEECAWGQFFRQIILPQEVDAARAQAKVRDGVLVLKMPLKAPRERKIRMNVVKMDSVN